MSQFADLIPKQNSFSDLIPNNNPFADLVPKMSRLESSDNAFIQSAAEVTGSMMQGTMIPRLKFNTDVNRVFDAIDQGNMPSRWDYFLSDYEGGDSRLSKHRPGYSLLKEYSQGDAEARKALRNKFSVNPDDQYLVQKGKELQEYAVKEFPTEQAYEGEFFADLIPRGMGSTAGFIGIGAATRGAGLGPLSGAALGGSLVNANSQFQEALSSNASFEDAVKASNYGGIIGLSEAIPIAKIFDRYDTATGGSIRRVITEGLKGGAEEGIQELSQSIGNMLIASKLVKYDPDRGFEGVGDATGVGFTVGALYSTIAAMLGARQRGINPESRNNAQEDIANDLGVSESDAGTTAPPGTGGNFTVSGTATGILSDTTTVSANNVFYDLIPGTFETTATQPEYSGLSPEAKYFDKVKAPVINVIRQKGGVKVGSTLDSELRHMGITPRTHPGLFKRDGGLSDIDNIVQSEYGIFEGAPVDQGGYVNSGWLLEKIADENQGFKHLPPSVEAELGAETATDAGPFNQDITIPAGPVIEGLDPPGFDWDRPQYMREVTQPPTKSPEFKKWFGDSKVVDEKGEPLVVYHGTNSDFSSFERMGREKGYYFSPDADYASNYATSFGADKKGANLIPALVSIKNPKYVLTKPNGSNGFDQDALDKVLAEGHDGLVVGVTEYEITTGAKSINDADEIVVFEPSQIKSVFNKGSYNASDPRIDYSKAPETDYMQPGKNYKGLLDPVDGSREVSAELRPAKKKQPLVRQNIAAEFLNDIGRPVFYGHIPPRMKALGFYRDRNKEVRVKKSGDIEVVAHEIAHAIDYDTPAVREAYKQKHFRDELLTVSYDNKNIKEGFAEFVRLWATQRENAKSAAPQFYDWFENFVRTNEKYGPALIKAQQNMTAWFDQSALDRARSKVGEFEQSAVQTVGSRFRQTVIDDLSGIEAVEKHLTGSVAAGGIYETARLSRGASGVLQGAVQYGAPKRMGDRTVLVDLAGQPSVIQATVNGKTKLVKNPKYNGGGLEAILEPVSDNLADFGLYAIGRRAAFLKSQGRENLFTRNEIEAMKALETPERRKAFADWNKFNKQVLDFAQSSGIINSKNREQWETDVYLPFWRIDKNSTKGKGGGSVIKKLTGGTSNVRDPIANIFQNTKMLIEAAIVNEAKRKVIRGIAEHDRGGEFIAKIPTTNKAVHVDKEQIRKEFQTVIDQAGGVDPETAFELEMQFESMEPFIRFWLHGQAPKGDDVVSFMEEGKTLYYQVADPILYRSLTNMPRQLAHNPVTRWLKSLKNISQMTVTLSVDFMLRNILRDTVMASVLSKNGFVPFVDAAKGFKHRVTSDPVYQEWLASGGAISGFFNDEGDLQRSLETFYKTHNIPYELVVNTPKKLLKSLSNIADSFEAATRLSEFRRTIEKGGTQKQAAFQSRDISSDFAMRGDGETLGFLYDTVMFLKAGVVGMDRVYRGLATDTNRGQVALKTGMLALASMGLYALNRDNPLYDELEDWEKDNHWHFFIPTQRYYDALSRGEDLSKINPRELYTHFRFPKPWEIGGIGTIAERSLAGVLDKDPSQAGAMLNVIREMFRYEFMPQAFKPLYEQATNNISFINRPIETPAMENVEPWARSAPSGSRLLREIGESTRNNPRALQINPARTEALLRGYFNTWAMYGLTLADAMIYDDMPDMSVSQIPGLRSIYKDGPGSSRYRTMFYEMLKEATEARATMRLMDRTNRMELGDEIAESPANLEYQRLTTANEYLQSISAEMKQVIVAKDLAEVRTLANTLARERKFAPKVAELRKSRAWNNTGALKRELLDIWGFERNQFVKEVVTDSQ